MLPVPSATRPRVGVGVGARGTSGCQLRSGGAGATYMFRSTTRLNETLRTYFLIAARSLMRLRCSETRVAGGRTHRTDLGRSSSQSGPGQLGAGQLGPGQLGAGQLGPGQLGASQLSGVRRWIA